MFISLSAYETADDWHAARLREMAINNFIFMQPILCR